MCVGSRLIGPIVRQSLAKTLSLVGPDNGLTVRHGLALLLVAVVHRLGLLGRCFGASGLSLAFVCGWWGREIFLNPLVNLHSLVSSKETSNERNRDMTTHFGPKHPMKGKNIRRKRRKKSKKIRRKETHWEILFQRL